MSEDGDREPGGAVPPIRRNRRREAPVAAAPAQATLPFPAASAEDDVDGGWDDVDALVAAPGSATTVAAPAPVPAAAAAPAPYAAPRASDPLPRKHDVRAPRSSRSTTDSNLYRGGDVAGAPERRPRTFAEGAAIPPPHRRGGSRFDTRGGGSETRGEGRRHDAARSEQPRSDAARSEQPRSDAARSDDAQRDAPRRNGAATPLPGPSAAKTSAPKKAPAVSPRVEPPAPEPPAKPAPSLADDLFVLGAKPVAEKVEKVKDKPRTAKEALQLRAAQKSGKRGKKHRGGPTRGGEVVSADVDTTESPGSSSSAAKKAKPTKSSVRSAKPASDRDDDDARDESDEDAPVAAPAPGFWAKVKRLFTS